MIRFEILLPLYHNDGKLVDPEKFVATDDQLLEVFGAISTDQVVVRGKWTYKSVIYSDHLFRIRLDTYDTPENWDAIRNIKANLKTRFEQLDIWITAHRIDIV